MGARGEVYFTDIVSNQNVMQPEQPTSISGRHSSAGIARFLFLIAVGGLPVLVLPMVGFPFLLAKIVWFSVFAGLAMASVTLASLRARSVSFPANTLAKTVLLLFCAYAFSTALSQDWRMSLAGSGAEVDSLLFMAMATLAFFLSASLFKARESVRALLTTIMSTVALVGLFQLVRFAAGEKFFSSGVFAESSVNLIGAWNDFGIIVGLLAVMSAAFIDSRRLSAAKFIMFCVFLVASLLILAVVNFETLWWLLIGASAVTAYGSIKVASSDLFDGHVGQTRRIPIASIIVASVAGSFLLWGSAIAPKIYEIVPVAIAEAQLTPQTVLEVTRSTYAQSALTTFFGSGPNTFSQQWLLYKPANLTSSQYWTLDFGSGFSTLLTSFVTGGLLVGLLFLCIPMLALMYFFKAISTVRDPEKREIVLVVSSATAILFGAICFYVPGQVIELLAFSLLGVFAALVVTDKEWTLPVGRGHVASSFALIAVALVFLVCAGMYVQRFIASRYEGKASVAASNGDMLTAEYNARRALATHRSDQTLHLLATLKFSEAQAISAETDKATEPTRAERFQKALSEASTLATSAATEYPNHWANWLTLAQLYEALIPFKIEGAYQRSEEAYANAIRLSPRNPQLYLMAARMEASANNEQSARAAVAQALTLKPNYTDAILFVVQLEIAKNNLEGALNAAIAALETAPDNTGLWFEVGVLAFNKGDDTTAKSALQKAIERAPDYANAKYFLGLVEYRLGNIGESIALFEGLASSNPENTELATMLATIKSGKSPFPPKATTPIKAPVKEN